MEISNKFGMFIHWGLYSLTKLQEQAVIRYDLDKVEYEKLIYKFNPKKFNPDKWVKLAKKCGMDYICFTTKHHDGFCMWDTKYTDYNIMNTPYKKDVLKMLAKSCAKYGIKLSLYYSNPDWNHPYGYNPNSTHQWLAVNKNKPDLDKYVDFVKNQISELLTNYGEIYTLFWDIPANVYKPELNALARKLQPNIIINDRGWETGDFSTPEREYSENQLTPFKRMTEACNSISEQSWGFREKDDYYTKKHLTSSIDKIMALGGSYLLNVGPDHLGVIRPIYKKHLKCVADWYKKSKISLKDADFDDYDYQIKNNKYIATKKDGKTYLHFYDWLISSAVAIKNYPNLPSNVRLLNSGKKLPFDVCLLPEFFDINTGHADGYYLHIYDIPVDKYYNEPIIIELDW